jgi:hypothetical protein
VLLALIGQRWLTSTDGDGRRRLDDPGDFVRLEIEAALNRNVRIIPILVEDAQMPSADDLPPSLGMLARRQALELSPNRFEFDIGRLIRVLDSTLTEVRAEKVRGTAPRRPPVAGTQGRATVDDRGQPVDHEQDGLVYPLRIPPEGSASSADRMPSIPAGSPGAPPRPHVAPAGWSPMPVPFPEANRPTRPSGRRRVRWAWASVAVAAGVGLSALAIVTLESGGTPQSRPPPLVISPSAISSSSSPTSTGKSSNFTKIVDLLPASFRGSCHSHPANVNTALGQTAVATCTIGGVGVTYTAYASVADLTNGLNSHAPQGQPSTGVCSPQGDNLSILYITQPFGYGGHSGTVFCNYGNQLNNSTIAWTDQSSLPLVLGLITVSPTGSYEQLYSSWRRVLAAE